jgi:hypothetical protein
MLELSAEAFRELGLEFIAHCLAGAFHQPDWWQWKVAGDSIWIEVIPEALVDGKPRRQTLGELLREADPGHKM